MESSGSRAICHLNHAGASPSPEIVLERVRQHLELEQKIGGYAAAQAVADEMNGIYTSIAKLVHAQSSREIALMGSATIAWTRAFYAIAERQRLEHPRRNVILISDAEYAANVVAVCQWARNHNWTVLSVPSCTSTIDDGKVVSTGIVDLTAFESMLSGDYEYTENGSKKILEPSRIAIACITHVPTNSGIVNPVEEMGTLIRQYNDRHEGKTPMFYLVDACQSVGQLDVSVERMQCHALAATGRKYMRGPRGTGFLYIAESVLDHLAPSHVDHFGVPVRQVPTAYKDGDALQDLIEFAPRPDARRFEFWEFNAACHLGFGKAAEFAMETSLAKIQADCIRLSSYLRERLNSIPEMSVHHDGSTTCGIVTFHAGSADPHSLKEKLFAKGFELSVVPATSTPLDSAKMSLPNLLRASISYTNTNDEIDLFVETLASVLPSAKTMA